MQKLSGGESRIKLASPEVESNKEFFIDQVDNAKQVLGPIFLDEMSNMFFQENMQPIINGRDKAMGYAIPVATYDGKTRVIKMRVEPDVTLDFADELAGSDGDAEDVAKLLIGAGVARCVVGWKLLPLKFSEGHPQTCELYDKIYDDNRGLLAQAQMFDVLNGTELEDTIKELSQEKIGEVNILRFAVGAAINYISDPKRWQEQWEPVAQTCLISELNNRKRDVEFSRSVLDDEGAQEYFDDLAPVQHIALAFPMSPAEEIESFATKKTPTICDGE